MQLLKIEFNTIDRDRKYTYNQNRKEKKLKMIRILSEPVEVKGKKHEVGCGFGADRGRKGLRIIRVWFVVVFPFVII